MIFTIEVLHVYIYIHIWVFYVFMLLEMVPKYFSIVVASI